MEHIQIPALNEPHQVTADVTVCTPSLPHRSQFRYECIEAVNNQTVKPRAHFVGIDHARVGGPKMLNDMIKHSETTWVAPIADDDLMYPNYLEVLLANSEGADMIYGWCNITGGRAGWDLKQPFDAKRLRQGPYIPATILLRKSVWEEFGGYSEVEVCEDYAFQLRLLDAGKVIRNVPQVIWEYRFHGRNVSDGKILPWEV